MPGAPILTEVISAYPSVLVGFSGGVDSALVAIIARQVHGRDKAAAALGISPSLSREQRTQAVSVARQFDLALVETETAEMDDPKYTGNPSNRCYFCKRELWNKLSALAADRGLAVVADGTNADDVRGHRPGMAAASEWVVQSPLRDAGYTKAMVREEARRMGLSIWDAPSAPCLSSRIRFGLPVTAMRLDQVARGERLIRALGVRGDLRVRHHGAEARIEVDSSEFDVVRLHRADIASEFRDMGFSRVSLDLRGYRSGSLLVDDQGTRASTSEPV